MKQCKKCSKEFPSYDSFCPECGAINSIYKNKIAVGFWVIVFLLGFILLFGVAACGSDSRNVGPIQEVSQNSENTIAENKLEDTVSTAVSFTT